MPRFFQMSRADGEPLDTEALRKVLDRNPNGHLYYFDYPVVDEAGEETGEKVTVATTRPETMLGDTAVAVHPDDERYQRLIGAKLRLPLVGRLIPVIADEYADPEKGAGAVKITPAHDFNDFDVGRRHTITQASSRWMLLRWAWTSPSAAPTNTCAAVPAPAGCMCVPG